MSEKLFLYKVSTLYGHKFQGFYAVAPDCGRAYQKVREYLDERDLGFAKDRELQTVELLAEVGADYPPCEATLLL